jgi:hypothetical protein
MALKDSLVFSTESILSPLILALVALECTAHMKFYDRSKRRPHANCMIVWNGCFPGQRQGLFMNTAESCVQVGIVCRNKKASKAMSGRTLACDSSA